LCGFSLANAEYMTRQQLIDRTQAMGQSLEQFCKTDMAQTPEQLAQQYGELRARHTPDQEEAYKQMLQFCISQGFISKDILR
jgi:hypothetical protein